MNKVQRLSRKRVGSNEIRNGEGYKIMKIVTTELILNRARNCGLEVLTSRRDGNVPKHTYICGGCKATKEVNSATLKRWEDTGYSHCPFCRGIMKGATSEEHVISLNAARPEFYVSEVEATDYLGYRANKKHSYCIIKFLTCNHDKEYNCTTFKGMMKQGKAFKCDVCNSSTSAQETLATKKVRELRLDIAEQVPYANLYPCDRDWTADYVIGNTIVEVTTIGMINKDSYRISLREKSLSAAKAGFLVFPVTDITCIQDIVRSLSKDIES